MSDGKPNKRWGLSNLVKYILVVDGKKLLLTSDDETEIKAVKAEMEDSSFNLVLVIENFGVKPDPKTSYADHYRDFKKVKGFSLWQVIK